MIIRITTLLLSVLFFLIFFVGSSFSYKSRYQNKYSLKNMFPFEFNYNSRFIDNFYGNSAIILSVFAAIFYFACFDTSFTNGLIIASSIAGIVCFIMIGFLVFLPLKLYKFHFVLASIFFTSSLVLSGLVMTAGFHHYQVTNQGVGLFTFVFGVILTLATFVILMNPKLTKPIKYEQKTLEDGNTINVRPKTIPLAFSEWLLIIISFLNMINMFILYSCM